MADGSTAELEELARGLGARLGIDPARLVDAARARARAEAIDADEDEARFEIRPAPDGSSGVQVEITPGVKTTKTDVAELFASSLSSEDDINGTFPVYYRMLGDVGERARKVHKGASGIDLVRALFAELQSGKAGDLDHSQSFTLAFDIALSDHWREAGRPRLVLTESLAAILSLTRSPPILWQFLPYPAVMIEVPRRFLPLGGPPGQPAWIFIGRVGDTGMMVDGVNAFVITARAFQHAATDEELATRSGDPAMARLAIRFVSNVLAFVSRHRECVRQRPAPRRAPGAPVADQVFDVRPPADLEVTRVLRDHAAALVAANSVEGAKRVLRHVVRGHWKNQPTGPGRTERNLIFVAPYVRGDESLGRVADKILRLEGAEVQRG